MFRFGARVRVARAWGVLLAVMIVASSCGARWTAQEDARAAGELVASSGDSPTPSTTDALQEVGGIQTSPPSWTTRTTGPRSGLTVTGDAGPHPGVTNTEITLCVLMPETGASPLPTAWEKGVNAFWDYLRRKGGVHGRNIRLIIKDTKSDTAEALARARDCINEGAFSFYTMDRVEVMSALSKFLDDQGIPHVLTFGPPTTAMNSGSKNRNTFVVSMDHRAQGRLVADYFSTGDLSNKRPAIVREDVPDAIPFAAFFKARLVERGRKAVAEEAINGQGNDFSQTVLNLKRANAEVVVAYMAPTTLIKLAQQAHAAAYDPVWFADAPSWNFDMVLQLANSNGALKGARAFSPWVALSSPAASTYKRAYAEMYPNEAPDDIGLIGWGLGEVMHAALAKAGKDLGYNSFRTAFQTLSVTPTTWGPLDFRPNRRVGTDSIIEFREDGDHWVQVGTFRSSF
ncbi:MAG: ABC transporter substrate-binding protein [Actinomycetota bacterium]